MTRQIRRIYTTMPRDEAQKLGSNVAVIMSLLIGSPGPSNKTCMAVFKATASLAELEEKRDTHVDIPLK